MALNLGSLSLLLVAKTQGFNSGLTSAMYNIGRLESMSSKAAAAIGADMALVGMSFSGAVEQAAKFQREMANVATNILTNVNSQVSRFSKQILALAPQVGQTASQLAAGVYQAISSGINPSQAINFIKTSAKAAIAGVSDTFTAVNALSSIVNAYGGDATKVAQYSDDMFTTIRLGKSTFEELAAQIGLTAPIAFQAGVTFKELSAAVAQLTDQGLSTQEATTGMRQALLNIIKPSKQASDLARQLGIEYDKQGLQSMGLVNFLNMVATATHHNTKEMAMLFGNVRGLNAVLALTSEHGMKQFVDFFNQMENDAGATNIAFAKLAATFLFAKDQFVAGSNALIIQIGTAFLPSLTALMRRGTSIVEMLSAAWQTLSDKQKQSIAIFAEIVTGALAAAAALAIFALASKGAVIGLGKIFDIARGALLFLTSPFIVGAAIIISASAAILEAWNSNFLGIQTTTDKVWKDIQPVVDAISNWIGKTGTTTWNLAVEGFNTFKNNVLPYLKDGVKTAWTWTVTEVDKGMSWVKSIAWPWINNEATTTWTWLTKEEEKSMSWVKNTAWPWINNEATTDWTWITQEEAKAMVWIKDKAWPWINSKVSTSWSWAVKETEQAMDWVKNKAWPWLNKTATTTWTWITKESEQSMSWVKNTAWPWINNETQTTWSWITKEYPTAMDWIKNKAWKYINQTIKTTWSWVLNEIDSVPGAIKTVQESIDKNGAMGTIKIGLNIAWNWVEDVATSLKKWLDTNADLNNDKTFNQKDMKKAVELYLSISWNWVETVSNSLADFLKSSADLKKINDLAGAYDKTLKNSIVIGVEAVFKWTTTIPQAFAKFISEQSQGKTSGVENLATQLQALWDSNIGQSVRLTVALLWVIKQSMSLFTAVSQAAGLVGLRILKFGKVFVAATIVWDFIPQDIKSSIVDWATKTLGPQPLGLPINTVVEVAFAGAVWAAGTTLKSILVKVSKLLFNGAMPLEFIGDLAVSIGKVVWAKGWSLVKAMAKVSLDLLGGKEMMLKGLSLGIGIGLVSVLFDPVTVNQINATIQNMWDDMKETWEDKNLSLTLKVSKIAVDLFNLPNDIGQALVNGTLDLLHAPKWIKDFMNAPMTLPKSAKPASSGSAASPGASAGGASVSIQAVHDLQDVVNAQLAGFSGLQSVVNAIYLAEGGYRAKVPYGQLQIASRGSFANGTPAGYANQINFQSILGSANIKKGSKEYFEAAADVSAYYYWEQFKKTYKLNADTTFDKLTQDMQARFIQYLGSNYAPVGAANDPANLNSNWVKNMMALLNIPGHATGAIMPGHSGPDQFLAMLAPGEAVVPSSIVHKGIAGVAAWFKSMGVPGFADGKAPSVGFGQDAMNSVLSFVNSVNNNMSAPMAFMEKSFVDLFTAILDQMKTLLVAAVGPDKAKALGDWIDKVVALFKQLYQKVDAAGKNPNAAGGALGKSGGNNPAQEQKTLWQSFMSWLKNSWQDVIDQADKLKFDFVDASNIAKSALSSFSKSVSNTSSGLLSTIGMIAGSMTFDKAGGFDLHGTIVNMIASSVASAVGTIGDYFATSANSLEMQSSAYQSMGPGIDTQSTSKAFLNVQDHKQQLAALNQKYAKLAQDQKQIDSRTIGGQVGGGLAGAAAGAAIGSIIPVIGTAIGALVGALFGSNVGGKSANQKAKEDLGKEMSATQSQIDKLQTGLTDYMVKLKSALGLTADDFANKVASALGAADYKTFETNLTSSVDGMIRNSLVQKFVANTIAAPIKSLSSSVFNDIVKNKKPDMEKVKDTLKTIENSSKPFYDMLTKLGIAGDDAANALHDVSLNVPSGFRANLAQYYAAGDIPHLAKGGLITSPTIALVGEAGPEIVSPVDKLLGHQGASRVTHIDKVIIVSNNPQEIWEELQEIAARENFRNSGTVVGTAPKWALQS